MSVKDKLGDRMKEFYENIPKTKLMRRCPACIRIDGCHFHTFTKNFNKPFDDILMTSMQETMQYLCANIQGCVFGYTQSDEITLILVDYQKLTSAAWFDYEVQKLCSVAASMATMKFNQVFTREVMCKYSGVNEMDFELHPSWYTDEYKNLMKARRKAAQDGATFDARCFNIPKEEVANLIYWRQNDASKNSVQMVGRAYFSHTELKNKNTNQIQDMLFTQKGINWNDFPVDCKRGAACIKEEIVMSVPIGGIMGDGDEETVVRRQWKVDREMPIIKGEDREYVEKHILI